MKQLEQGLSKIDNEQAKQLYDDHQKAVKRIGRLDGMYGAGTPMSVDGINHRSREEFNAPNAYDANLWRAQEHYRKHQAEYVDQGTQEAADAGVHIDVSDNQ